MIRAGVVCDMLEEKWTSMDLVADMTLRAFERCQGVAAERIRAGMTHRFDCVSSSRVARNADRFLNRFWDYPRWLRSRDLDFDVYHVVDHSYAHLAHALPAERTVVVCHDVDAFASLFREDASPLQRAMARHTLSGLQRAARVICVSNATRDEAVRRELVPAEKIEVVYQGVDPGWSAHPDPLADAEAASLLGGDAPRLLHVGTTIPRKRIDILLRVFASLRGRFPRLRLARVGGSFTAEQEELALELGVRCAIDVLPRLDRSTLAAVYRRCAVLLQTSEREGFGLPVAEAMACGVPVVATDIPVMREVGGEAAVYCPLGAVESWHEAAAKILDERASDPLAWAARKKSVIGNAERFSWDSFAERVLTIYEQILEEEKRAKCKCFTLGSTIRRTVGESRAT